MLRLSFSKAAGDEYCSSSRAAGHRLPLAAPTHGLSSSPASEQPPLSVRERRLDLLVDWYRGEFDES